VGKREKRVRCRYESDGDSEVYIGWEEDAGIATDGGREEPSKVNPVGASQRALRKRLGCPLLPSGQGRVDDKAWEGVSGYLTAREGGIGCFWVEASLTRYGDPRSGNPIYDDSWHPSGTSMPLA
jgi:hypothetical protein